MKKYILSIIILFTTFQSYSYIGYSVNTSAIRSVTVEKLGGKLVIYFRRQGVYDSIESDDVLAGIDVKPQYRSEVVALIKSLLSSTRVYDISIYDNTPNTGKIMLDKINLAKELLQRGWVKKFRIEIDNADDRASFNEYYNDLME